MRLRYFNPKTIKPGAKFTHTKYPNVCMDFNFMGHGDLPHIREVVEL